MKLVFYISLCVLISACRVPNDKSAAITATSPPKILWAWERPEELGFLDTKEFGVAFLAQTLYLLNEEVKFSPRRQALEVPGNTYLIAVSRIETRKDQTRPILSDEQRERIVSLIKNTLELPNVKGVQIDFDVVASERVFYRSLIVDLKKELPEKTPLTITALASWCVGDTWFNDLPIDEAVPMVFQMGADNNAIRDFLGKGNDWNEPLCRGSYGISTSEPLKIAFKPNRTFYFFNEAAWKESDLKKLGQ